MSLLTNVKAIDCPEHPGKHNALLFCDPHRWAGTWECPEGLSDTHEHDDLQIETFTVDIMRNGGHDQYEAPGYVCADCGVQVDGDPALDAAEDRADMAYDEWRDEQL
jgi:hypothetical protein